MFTEDLRQFLASMLLTLAALLPIVNPLGGAPVYLVKTIDLTREEHAYLSRRVAINCFLLLMASLLVGTYVLDLFGLSIPIVQVGGGLVVCSLGWSLLGQPDEPIEWVHETARPISHPELSARAFYPLTMPLTVGPGSISVAITLGANRSSHTVRSVIIENLAHAAGVLVVALSVFVCYRYAERLLRRLGPTGSAVILRLSAFILLCIGVQILWNGLTGLWLTLPPH